MADKLGYNFDNMSTGELEQIYDSKLNHLNKISQENGNELLAQILKIKETGNNLDRNDITNQTSHEICLLREELESQLATTNEVLSKELHELNNIKEALDFKRQRNDLLQETNSTRFSLNEYTNNDLIIKLSQKNLDKINNPKGFLDNAFGLTFGIVETTATIGVLCKDIIIDFYKIINPLKQKN